MASKNTQKIEKSHDSHVSIGVPKPITAIVKLFRETINAWLRDKASRQAAALAYYGVLSLAPLLIIAISVAGLFFGRADVKQQVIAEVTRLLGTSGAELVETVLNTTYQGNGGILATLVSLGLLLMAATNIFFQLKTSLNRIWDVESHDEDSKLIKDIFKLLMDRLVAAVMVIGFGFVLLLSQITSTIISVFVSIAADFAVSTSLLLQLLNAAASIGLTAVIVSLIFRFLPDKQLAWGDIWIGSVFTAVLSAVGQRLISLYLENSSVASAYGIAGSLIVILLWIYYSASILLFGAEFTQAYAHLYGSQAGEKA